MAAASAARGAPRSVHQLVDAQAARWNRSHVRAEEPGPAAIAVARLGCSGAHEIAEGVARRLGYGFFGSEIVDAIARDQGVGRELVAGLDERVRNAIERYVIDGFRHHEFGEAEYRRAVTRIVTTLAHRGRAVILGRGAAAIVDPARTLRVLVVAPLAWRSARLAERERIALDVARDRLTAEDSGRRAFYRRDFGFDHTDPLNHHLVLNTAELGIEAAERVVVSAYAQRFGG